MAKKKDIIEEHKSEPVIKRDQSMEPVEVVHYDLKNADIENLIRTIRGQKVMVDFDLSMLYGVKTKALNQAVKRNIKRFPDDFMFQLAQEEWNLLRSQIVTAKQPENKSITLLRSQFVTTKDISKIRTLPYAFTREGIGMLSSVLGSDTAIEMNIRIMRVFTVAHQIMENNALLFQKVLHIEQHQLETDEVKFVQLPHKNHDRFLIVDDNVYLLGASVKDMGNGLCAVAKLTATPETVLGLLK